MTFIDGQNLYHAIKSACGATEPNYHPKNLSQWLADLRGWQLSQVRFYTGVPEARDKPDWHQYWNRKLLSMSRSGVWHFTRPLRKRMKSVVLDDGTEHKFTVFEEKGIDVRIAVDLITLAYRKDYDVAVIFSQDQDLSEAVKDVFEITKSQGRSVEVYSAFPIGRDSTNHYGINGTKAIAITEADYNDHGVDRFDYWKAIRGKRR